MHQPFRIDLLSELKMCSYPIKIDFHLVTFTGCFCTPVRPELPEEVTTWNYTAMVENDMHSVVFTENWRKENPPHMWIRGLKGCVKSKDVINCLPQAKMLRVFSRLKSGHSKKSRECLGFL